MKKKTGSETSVEFSVAVFVFLLIKTLFITEFLDLMTYKI